MLRSTQIKTHAINMTALDSAPMEKDQPISTGSVTILFISDLYMLRATAVSEPTTRGKDLSQRVTKPAKYSTITYGQSVKHLLA